MKLLDNKQRDGHRNAVYRGALEGTIASSIVSGAGVFWANRRYPKFKTLPLTIKTLAFIIVVAPILSIQAERRGLEYEQSQWAGRGVGLLKNQASAEDSKWDEFTFNEKARHWFMQHQYTTITGAWALSLIGAGAIISRQRGSTTGQKLVQARMYAQAFTIALLVGAGIVSTQEKIAHPVDRVDHSWIHVIEEREHEREQHQQQQQS